MCYLIMMHLLYVVVEWSDGFKECLEFWTSSKSFEAFMCCLAAWATLSSGDISSNLRKGVLAILIIPNFFINLS
jgi:hypothetical protein